MNARRKPRHPSPTFDVRRTPEGTWRWTAMLPGDLVEASHAGFSSEEEARTKGRLWLEAREQTMLRLAS